jgi:hypothetical protein
MLRGGTICGVWTSNQLQLLIELDIESCQQRWRDRLQRTRAGARQGLFVNEPSKLNAHLAAPVTSLAGGTVHDSTIALISAARSPVGLLRQGTAWIALHGAAVDPTIECNFFC